MLRQASELNGVVIAAADGRLGHVSDVLFDDRTWMVRWIVVDCGSWLAERKVLLPPSVLGVLHLARREFTVRLTRQEVRDSPDIDTDKSVTRQMEGRVYDHYGWTPYWGTTFALDGGGYMSGSMEAPYIMARDQPFPAPGPGGDAHSDPHLRSANALKGYHLHATDGGIGHVEALLLEDSDWSLRYVVVATKDWWPGKRVLIAPRSVSGIDWSERKMDVAADRAKIRSAPAYTEISDVGRAYDEAFQRHYATAV